MRNDNVQVIVLKHHKGPKGPVIPGDTYTTDAGHASVLVERGYAEITKTDKPQVKNERKNK